MSTRRVMGSIPTPLLVAAIRRQTSQTQEGLARELGVSYATVNAWERGRNRPHPGHRVALEEMAERVGVGSDLVVLVVDDDPASCAVVEGMLASSGGAMDVVTTTSGSEALLLCGTLKPDVLFLDILMPGIDGLEVARRVKRIPELEHMRIVFITASTNPQLIERAQAAGAADVLLKPLTQEKVNGALRIGGGIDDAGLTGSEGAPVSSLGRRQ
ncbi:MAG: response regulator [Acidobacteria bacterium]|nr:response regulator [Acidobacteriota bacterium]